VVERPDRVSRLTALIDDQPGTADDRPGTPGRLRRLCTTVTQVLPSTWAGLSLAENGKVSGAITGSDAHARELETLQFTFGEGPCVDSLRSGGPVIEPDLATSGFPRWPAYAPEAYERGIRAVYAFPLQIGDACVGALDVYRDRAAPASSDAISVAQTFARIALTMLVGDDPLSAADAGVAALDDMLVPVLEVYQAQGMVMVDLGVSLAEALVRLRAHAFVEGRPVADVARDVVAGRLRLER
jgi:hypothetical protein